MSRVMSFKFIFMSALGVLLFIFFQPIGDREMIDAIHYETSTDSISVLDVPEGIFDDSVPDNTLEFVEVDLQAESQPVTEVLEVSAASSAVVAYKNSRPLPSVLGDLDERPGHMYFVSRVIDGDTIEVTTPEGVRRVRYIGVDTPETVHPSKPVACFGKEASEKNTSLVEGKWVRLERDISDTDRYGRWLRYVYVDDEFVNLSLVSQGYATVVTYPPDVKFTELFRTAEQIARREGRGLWGSICQTWVVPTAPPTIPQTSQAPPNLRCNIKGNINSNGEKIYHYPGCKSYAQTIITEDTGERWFCSETEAINAGWRRAGNC